MIDRSKKRFLTAFDLETFQLPRCYWHLTYKDFHNRPYYTDLSDYILAMADVLREGRSLFLYGISGSGKSALAYYIARTYAEYGTYVHFASAQDLHDSIEARAWDSKNEVLLEDFYRKEVEMLVVDDFGMEAQRKASRIPQLFSDRHHNVLPTIFTSSIKDLGELEQMNQYPKFIKDKISRFCTTICCGTK